MTTTKKADLNLVVIGHVDAGKSTTSGHLIFKLGGVSERVIEKYKKESQELGKGSFSYAWVLDSLESERKRGITIKSAMKQFETTKYKVTIIDAPGHRDFINNMIKGTTQADHAMLVVAAPKKEFEAGMSKNGQTREHILLASSIGIKSFIVVINKMDDSTVKYSKDRYDEIVREVGRIIKKTGSKVTEFVPICGFEGENLVERSKNMDWYNGKTVVESIDSFDEPSRALDKPFRMSLSEIYKVSGVGEVFSGRVETGTVKKEDKIFIAPGNVSGAVKSVEKFKKALELAVPGDNIGITLKAKSPADVVVKVGALIGDAKVPPCQITEFEAKLVVLDIPNPVSAGYSPVINIHSAKISCKLLPKIDKLNKMKVGIEEENVASIEKGNMYLVNFQPLKDLAAELYDDFRPLGRFCVRDNKRTVGFGTITKKTVKQ